VPLDPGAPLPRIEGIIRHCGIRCLVSHSAKQRELRDLLTNALIPLDGLIGVTDVGAVGVEQISWDDVRQLPAKAPEPDGLTEQDLAYIMYTSGSTGPPKGMMHTHHSGLSYAGAAASLYDVTFEDRLSNHSPLHFDMSTFDYFSGPLVGACTVIIPEAYAKLPASLSQLIEDERLSVWYSVPFALIQLLLHGALSQRDLSALRHVMFGGEPFPSKYLAGLMQRLPNAQFCNVYGPAEVNQCTYYFVPDDWPADAPPVPLGKIWDNAEGIVIDEAGGLQKPGQAGELLIRSPTMMRGYWNRPELNAHAFYERPVTEDVNDRFYRTGDLVIEQEDGELRFLGRLDRQVKVRGFRIELDEVESALVSHRLVEEAAVYAVPCLDGTLDIQASVCLKEPGACAADELVKHLAGLLPGYANPSHIETMDAFPRTTSGKIDRNLLRDQALKQREQGSQA